MAEPKTRENDKNVEAFLASIEPESKRQDSFDLLEIFKEVTGEEARMWGDSIVGFGKYTMTYANGSKRNWASTGFSPRKQNFTVYITDGFEEYQGLLSKLGKHSTSKVCVYFKKLEDIEESVLRDLIAKSMKRMAEDFPLEEGVE
jgi:hypothetical protein